MSDVFCKACKDHDISFEAIEAKVAEIENAFSFLRDPHIGTALDVITALRARIAKLEGALRAVISVSDRKTDIYDRAKAALASAGEEAGERLVQAPAHAQGDSQKHVLERVKQGLRVYNINTYAGATLLDDDLKFCAGRLEVTSQSMLPPITPPPTGVAQDDDWQPIATAPRDGTEIILRGTCDDTSKYCPLIRVTHWKPAPARDQ